MKEIVIVLVNGRRCANFSDYTKIFYNTIFFLSVSVNFNTVENKYNPFMSPLTAKIGRFLLIRDFFQQLRGISKG